MSRIATQTAARALRILDSEFKSLPLNMAGRCQFEQGIRQFVGANLRFVKTQTESEIHNLLLQQAQPLKSAASLFPFDGCLRLSDARVFSGPVSFQTVVVVSGIAGQALPTQCLYPTFFLPENAQPGMQLIKRQDEPLLIDPDSTEAIMADWEHAWSLLEDPVFAPQHVGKHIAVFDKKFLGSDIDSDALRRRAVEILQGDRNLIVDPYRIVVTYVGDVE